MASEDAPPTPLSLVASEIDSENGTGNGTGGHDVLAHTQRNQKRNIHKVIFGDWQIRTWCVSYRNPAMIV